MMAQSRNRNKTFVFLILSSLVILNIFMAAFVFLPSEPPYTVNSDSNFLETSTEPNLSPMDQFYQLDLAAKNFWTNLLPFWKSTK